MSAFSGSRGSFAEATADHFPPFWPARQRALIRLSMDVEAARKSVEILSYERFRYLIEPTGAQSGAIERHQEILDLGCELMKVIAIVEIALRNTVVANLTQHFIVGNRPQCSPRSNEWREFEQRNVTKAIKQARRAKHGMFGQAERASHNGQTRLLANRPGAVAARESLSRGRPGLNLARGQGFGVASGHGSCPWARLLPRCLQRTVTWQLNLP